MGDKSTMTCKICGSPLEYDPKLELLADIMQLEKNSGAHGACLSGVTEESPIPETNRDKGDVK